MDETLTFRILKLSKTKRTLLANRGTDDGLEIDNHAKFYLTSTGVVARAVVRKISPTRSVWAIYRLINESEINTGRVLQLKSVSAVKLSKDPTKMLNVPPASIPIDGGGTLADLESKETKEEREDLKSLKERSFDEEPNRKGYFGHLDSHVKSRGDGGRAFGKKSWDAFTNFSLNSLSAKEETISSSKVTSKSEMALSIGIEKYFPSSEITFFKRTSLFGEFEWIKNVSKDTSGGTDQGDVAKTAFSGGVNYHLFTDPFSFDSFIPFVGFGFGMGTDKREYTDTNETSFSESNAHYFLGAGVKFYAALGIGLKGMVDYYVKNQNQTNSQTLSVTTYETVGFRTRLGLTYRF
tara:strand:+ start:3925 stop:4977 length:1053 start_codon:yes stop_codon:yes gene_type:complete